MRSISVFFFPGLICKFIADGGKIFEYTCTNKPIIKNLNMVEYTLRVYKRVKYNYSNADLCFICICACYLCDYNKNWKYIYLDEQSYNKPIFIYYNIS